MAWLKSEKYDKSRGIISKYWGSGGNRTYNLRLHHSTVGALSTEVSSNGLFQKGASITVRRCWKEGNDIMPPSVLKREISSGCM